MSYWVCEIDYGSYGALRIHTADCQNAPGAGKHTHWDKFPTLREAIKQAQARSQPESRGCGNCLPALGLLWEELQPIPLATLLGRVPAQQPGSRTGRP